MGEGKKGKTTVPRTGETNRSRHFSEQRLMSKNCRGGGGGGDQRQGRDSWKPELWNCQRCSAHNSENWKLQDNLVIGRPSPFCEIYLQEFHQILRKKSLCASVRGGGKGSIWKFSWPLNTGGDVFINSHTLKHPRITLLLAFSMCGSMPADSTNHCWIM